MNQTHQGRLARFSLSLIAPELGRRDPSAEYALHAALAEANDHVAGAALWRLYKQKASVLDSLGSTVMQAADLLQGVKGNGGWVPAQLVWERIVAGRHDAPWGAALAHSPQLAALERAWRRWREHDHYGATQLLGQIDLASVDPELAQLFSTIAAILGAGAVTLPQPPARGGQAIQPDPRRGREGRAELVGALLVAERIDVREVEGGRARPLEREELIDAILRDPRWDDIDAAEQRADVVDRILGEREPSPAISLRARGLPDVFIARIRP